jgi:translation initiation factor 2B subunit (eIF-2B alpha/beta/delta family)
MHNCPAMVWREINFMLPRRPRECVLHFQPTEVSMFRLSKFIAVLIAAAMILGSSSLATAVDRERKCEQRIHKAEDNLQKAIRKHGEHSRQAEQKRHQLEEARERCHDRDHDHDGH